MTKPTERIIYSSHGKIRLHQANSSQKWRSLVKNAKMEKSGISLYTYVQCVEDFKFCVMAAGNDHRPPQKVIVKMYKSGLKPEIFREEIYSCAFETLVDVMAETRHELANYRDICVGRISSQNGA